MNASQLFNVKGLVVVITGGGSGLGLTMAKALEANGAAKVFICGRNFAKLEAASKQADHGNIIPLECDTTSTSSLASAAAQVRTSTGHVDLLIANAGVATTAQFVPRLTSQNTLADVQKALLAVPQAAYAEQFAVHFTGTMSTVAAFLDLLGEGNRRAAAQGGGGWTSQIIATGSAQAFNLDPLSGFGYSCSKAAETHLLRSLGWYLSPFGIRCNVVAPGLYNTDMTSAALKGLASSSSSSSSSSSMEDGTAAAAAAASELLVSLQSTTGVPSPLVDTDDSGRNGTSSIRPDPKLPAFITPMQRVGKDNEIAALILYLAGPSGAYCNGSVYSTDGGRLIGRSGGF